MRLLLQAHIDSRGDGDVGEAIVLHGRDGPVRLSYKRRHSRPVVTLFGEIRVTRMSYGGPGCPAIHPLDRQLRLPGRTWSHECQRRLLRAGVCSPFDEAISFFAEMTGRVVPKRSAEQLVREAAATVAAVHDQAPVVRTPQEILDSLFSTDGRPERQPRPRAGPASRR